MKLASALFLLFATASAQAAGYTSAWLQHFYQTNDVAPFNSYWDAVLGQQMLASRNQSSPVIGFSSQVFHRHPELLKGHIDHIGDFSLAEQPALLQLLWLTDTAESRAVLAQAAGNPYSGKAPPTAGELEIKTGQNLDLCWGWYFATGDTAAIDRIIAALAVGKDAGALKRYPTSQKTDADKAAALKDAICGVAIRSLVANGRSDPLVARHIRKVFFDKTTSPAVMPILMVVFAKLGDVPVKEWESEGGPAVPNPHTP